MFSNNNRRIAKNTIMLYIRMLLSMSVSLYTSRIVLNTLGVDDFGIYNVVGGFVSMFGFLNTSMASATQRFLSYEIGKRDYAQLAKVFSMSVNIHFIIALIIFILAETVGLWFVNNQLTIPDNRMNAAQWVYQFSILTFVVNVISVPYNASIIAHERMNIFALLSILEVFLKLGIVLMLILLGYDKLVLYAILVFSVAIIIRILYGLYCKYKFKETQFHFIWNISLFKILISYAGWNLWGNIAGVMHGQGVNILINIFFGPIVNAARGIAYQIQGAVNSFVINFQMAMNPQIIKLYASRDLKYMHKLIYSGAKFSFFLILLLSLPILLKTNYVLMLWLKVVPEYTMNFTRLVIINALIDSISGTLMTAAQGSGKIKLYQGAVGGLLLLNLPVSYFFLRFGCSPEITLYISIFFSIIALIVRLLIISPLVDLSIIGYMKNVILKIVLVTILSVFIPFLLMNMLSDSLFNFAIIVFCSFISVFFSIYALGLSYDEKVYFKKKANHYLKRLIK